MSQTLYEIFQHGGRSAVEAAATQQFGVDATKMLLDFAILGNHNHWAADILTTLTPSQRVELHPSALKMACLVTNEDMIKEVLSWGVARSEDLPDYTLFLLRGDGGSVASLSLLLNTLATSETNLDTALAYECRLAPHPHQREMTEGLCKHASPLSNERLPLLYALQENNMDLFAGMMPKLLSIPNAHRDVMQFATQLGMSPLRKAQLEKMWAQGEAVSPVWEKNRIRENLQAQNNQHANPQAKRKIL